MDEAQFHLTDEQVALLIQQGDKEKFSLLMKRYETKIFRYGRKFLSNKENIEDIVQDVFMNTFQNIQSFDPSMRFSSWIYRIAHNAFVNSLKKNSRNPLTLFDFDFDTLLGHPIHENPILMEQEQKEMKQMVDVGLHELPSKYKEVIILYYLEEFSYKEISDILKIPMSTVGVRIKRGKDALKAVYEKLHIHYEQ